MGFAPWFFRSVFSFPSKRSSVIWELGAWGLRTTPNPNQCGLAVQEVGFQGWIFWGDGGHIIIGIVHKLPKRGLFKVLGSHVCGSYERCLECNDLHISDALPGPYSPLSP